MILLCFQYLFWNGIDLGSKQEPMEIWKGSHSIKPDLAIVPEPPTAMAVKALSWGDEEFYFRTSALTIQNAGDTFGRTTALVDYDYSKLYMWWKILDSLNSTSDFVPPLVSYYFGSSREHKRDIPYVVKYLVEHADKDPLKKWWWYSQAVYHAKHKLKDLDLALEIAEKMAKIPQEANAPLWIRQMPAFILEAKGEYGASCKIIANIIENKDDVSEGELNFMYHFIRSRIRAMAIEDEKGDGIANLDPVCRHIVELEKEELKKLRELEK